MADTPPNRILLVPVDDTEVEQDSLLTFVYQQVRMINVRCRKTRGP